MTCCTSDAFPSGHWTETAYSVRRDDHGSDIMKAIAQCRKNENRAFIDEELEDGSVVHSFLRRIIHNPVNGKDSGHRQGPCRRLL